MRPTGYRVRLKTTAVQFRINDSVSCSVVNKDLSLKAKAKDLTSEHVQGPSRTDLDYGVLENIKLRKSNSMVTQVHAINTLFTDLWSTVETFMR